MKDARYDILCERKQTIANAELRFNFKVQGSKYLVKNLTEGDIYVDFIMGKKTNSRFLIPENCAQAISINGGYDTVFVYPTATSNKGVEVQCLEW